MNTRYEIRVAELESEGMTTGDAQGVADVEFAQGAALRMLAALKAAQRRICEDCPPGNWESDPGEHSDLCWQLMEAIEAAEGRS